MKIRFFNFLSKLATAAAALAFFCANSNINSTCIFMSYQPDVPNELEN